MVIKKGLLERITSEGRIVDGMIDEVGIIDHPVRMVKVMWTIDEEPTD